MIEQALPEEIKDRYNKASMAVNKKNYDYAIELLMQIINIRPDFAKGRQLLRVAEIKKFEENPPNIILLGILRLFSFLYALVAFADETKGNYHRAISIYENILRKDPKNTSVLVRLGNLLKIEGLKEASAATLESAVHVSAKNPLAYELLGEVYSDIGNYERARYCFRKVLELKPRDANAEKGLKNLDALTTIDKSFEKKDSKDFRIRKIEE